MLPRNTERILATLPDDATLLDVGGWAAPFNRATHVIDVMPWETRGAMGEYGPRPERFSPETWEVRDFCDHEPWPYPDDFFDFALCVTTLEDIRDPIWVCSEMSRVAKAGYVEVPTIIAELIYGIEGRGNYLGHQHHRWLCTLDEAAGEAVFLHKSHQLHAVPEVRVLPRWVKQMTLDDHLQGMFWEGSIHARERVVVGPYPFGELEAIVRARFQPSPATDALRRAKLQAGELRGRAVKPLRKAAERVLARTDGR